MCVCMCVCMEEAVGRLWFAGNDWEKEGEGGREGGTHWRSKGRERESTVPIIFFFTLRFRQPALLTSPPPHQQGEGRREERKAPDWRERLQQIDKPGIHERRQGSVWKTSAAGKLHFFPQTPTPAECATGRESERKYWLREVDHRGGKGVSSDGGHMDGEQEDEVREYIWQSALCL